MEAACRSDSMRLHRLHTTRACLQLPSPARLPTRLSGAPCLHRCCSACRLGRWAWPSSPPAQRSTQSSTASSCGSAAAGSTWSQTPQSSDAGATAKSSCRQRPNVMPAPQQSRHAGSAPALMLRPQQSACRQLQAGSAPKCSPTRQPRMNPLASPEKRAFPPPRWPSLATPFPSAIQWCQTNYAFYRLPCQLPSCRAWAPLRYSPTFDTCLVGTAPFAAPPVTSAC